MLIALSLVTYSPSGLALIKPDEKFLRESLRKKSTRINSNSNV